MSEEKDTSLVIKDHDFQKSKNGLKRFASKVKDTIALSSVPTDGGLFKLGDHKVTGSELNGVTSQIQDYLIRINELNQELVNEFGEVYQTFDYLDKDYISGIVGSIQAIEKVSKDEQEDRATIKKTVKVLSQFKNDLEKIKHLMDIDKAWISISKQEKAIADLNEYRAELSRLEHIKDVDILWGNVNAQSVVLQSFRDTLEKANEILLTNGKAIAELVEMFGSISDHQATIEERFEMLEEEIQNKYAALRESQERKLSSIEQKNAEMIAGEAQKQQAMLGQINQAQTDKLAEISDIQIKELKAMNKALEAEKESMCEMISDLTKKIKLAYFAVGGAAAITVIHLVLNVVGIL